MTNPSTQLRALEGEIEAHDKAASRGPWAHDLNGFIAQPGDDGEWGDTLLMTPRCPTEQNKRDADFAAFARTALPQLLTIAKELEDALKVQADEVELKSAALKSAWETEDKLTTENATLKRRLDEAMKEIDRFRRLEQSNYEHQEESDMEK